MSDRAVLAMAAGAWLAAGLAFDDDGSLWIAGLDGNVTSFTREQLVASGPVAPNVNVTVDGHGLLWGAAFWPRPAGLPLN